MIWNSGTHEKWRSGRGWEFVDMKVIGKAGLSGRVSEAAIKVHRSLGSGFLKSACENALCVELDRRGLCFERQKVATIRYEGCEAGEHRVDRVVEGELLVELKAVKEREDVFFAVGRSDMKSLGLDDGLMLSFAAMPLAFRRIGRERAAVRTGNS